MLKKIQTWVLIFSMLLGMIAPPLTASAANKTTRYEAEAFFSDTAAKKIHTSTTNASGGQSVTIYTGQYVEITFSVAAAGNYDITLCYAVYSDLSGQISVNGQTAQAYTFSNFETSGANGWNTFGTVAYTATLNAGSNTIKIANVDSSSSKFINFDYIEVTEAEEASQYPAAIGRHEAENAASFTQGSAGTHTIESNSAFSGGAAVGNMNTWPNDGRAYCTTKVYAQDAGTYQMAIGYAGGETNHPCNIDVRVNNGSWISTLAPVTAGWNTVNTISLTVTLEKGVNTIDVTGASNVWYSGMGWEWINLDYFELSKISDAQIQKTGVQLKNEGLVSYRGRNMTNGDAITFDYSGSGFEFTYIGSGTVTANITTTGTEKFAVDVDGTVTYTSFNAKTGDLTLASNLSYGTHTIKVYKTQEAMSGLAQLNYLKYSSSAKLSPINTDYNFLIIGASSTCGNQMDPSTGAENGYLAFPSVVSRAFNATWQQISVSGRGCTQGTLGESGWTFSQQYQLAELFTYQSWFRDKSTKFNTSSYVPDVIITNFNNDFGANALASGYSVDEVFTHMFEFIKTLRSNYPNAYIVMTYGNYPNYDSAGVYTNYSIIEKYKSNVEQYKTSSGDNKIAFVTFPCLTNGQSGHPSADEHQYMSELVCAQVSSFLGVSNPMPQTHFEIENGILKNAGDSGKVTKITTWASKFSNNSYVEGLNVNLGSTAIASDGSNVKYVSVPVTVSKSGTYTVELNYATDGTPDIYIRTAGGQWQKVSLASTTSWATVGQNTSVTLNLSAGSNTIEITGATNGSYVCLDRIDLTYKGN